MTVLLALVASVLIGSSGFIGGVSSRRASPLRVAALAQLIAFALAVPVALLVNWEQVTVTSAAWSLSSGVAAACALGLFYSAMARGLISIVVPVTAVIGASLPVAYAVARGERPGNLALVGIALALVAIAIVSATPSHGRTVPAAIIVLSVAAGACSGAFIVFLSRASENAGLWPIAFSRFTSSLVLTALALILTRPDADGINRLLPACLTIGVFEVAGTTALLLALQRGPISVASVLSSLYPVTAVLLAIVVLRERLSRYQLAGVTLALSSVILISAR